jgi:hypothetical protein
MGRIITEILTFIGWVFLWGVCIAGIEIFNRSDIDNTVNKVVGALLTIGGFIMAMWWEWAIMWEKNPPEFL